MPSLSPGDLLLDGLCVGLCKQVEHGAAEVVGVAVGVAQLVGDGVQEEIPACRREHWAHPAPLSTHTLLPWAHTLFPWTHTPPAPLSTPRGIKQQPVVLEIHVWEPCGGTWNKTNWRYVKAVSTQADGEIRIQFFFTEGISNSTEYFELLVRILLLHSNAAFISVNSLSATWNQRIIKVGRDL